MKLYAPAETPVSAPAAPAPAPSPTPTPTPAAPAPAATPAPSGEDDPFAKLDQEFITPPKPAPTPASEDKDKGKGKEKPAETPARPASPVTAPQLRAELDRVKGELATKNTTLESLQAKLKDLEDRNKDTTAVMAKIGTLEKQIADKEAELRKAEFKASPAYEKQYTSQWNRKTTIAMNEVQSLNAGEWRTNAETNEREFVPTRKADWEKDFATIYNLARPEARMRARQIFGPEDSDLVMEHYTELHRFKSEMNDALEVERTEWQNSRDNERAERARHEEGFKGACAAVQKDFEGKFPDWYQPDPADKKTEELMKQGWDLVHMRPQTFQQAVILATRNRMNAAAAPMLQYKLSKLQGELAEAKEAIEKLKGSKPGESRRSGVPAPPPDQDSEEAWKQAAREFMHK